VEVKKGKRNKIGKTRIQLNKKQRINGTKKLSSSTSFFPSGMRP